ncbi:MAG: hypothetical protein V4638_01070 [Bacteroidota bacterium]
MFVKNRYFIFLVATFSFLGTEICFGQNEAAPKALLMHQNLEDFAVNEKVEIGLSLPAEVNQKIENFVLGINSPQEQLNPYLEWDVRVFAEFTLDGSSDVITVDGFYFKDFDAWSAKELPTKSSYIYTSADIKKLGGYKEKNTEQPFRVRFSPPSKGIWTAKVHLVIDGEPLLEYEAITFSVKKEATTEFISITENKRFFAQGNEVFYPSGMNLSWPETDNGIDPEFNKGMCGYSEYDKKIMCGNEGYMDTYVAPRTYQKYRELMVNLAKEGANFMRTIMYPTGTEIEWEQLGNYSKRMHMALEMDSILETAEKSNIYLLWDMQTHYSFQLSERAYHRNWSWDKKMNGYDFCYKKLVKNNDPVDFFTNAEAKRYYQQRIRYIIARWGYSPNILGFELFCEITNVGSPKADNNDFYRTGENYKIYRDWQVEMGAYVKSFYYGKRHLLTASYGGEKHEDDDTFHHPVFDFMSSNIYDFEHPDFANYYIKSVAGGCLDETKGDKANWHSYSLNRNYSGKEDYQIRKPMIYSEADAIGATCDSTVVELRRAIWQATFSGLAGSFSWDFRFRKKYYSIYGQIEKCINEIDLLKYGWHPGATENVEGNWEYNEAFAKSMNPKMKYRKVKGKNEGPADVSFLRSEDKNFAMGVITNKTFNSKTADSCNHQVWPNEYNVLNVARSIELANEGPSIPGMSKGKYEIEYFYVNDPKRSVGFSTSSGPNLTFDFTIPANNFNYIVIFKAKKVGSSWKEVQKSSIAPKVKTEK